VKSRFRSLSVAVSILVYNFAKNVSHAGVQKIKKVVKDVSELYNGKQEAQVSNTVGQRENQERPASFNRFWPKTLKDKSKPSSGID
jgi:hypothetical protein